MLYFWCLRSDIFRHDGDAESALYQFPGDKAAVRYILHIIFAQRQTESLDRGQSLLKPGGVLISKTVCLAEQTRLWAIPISLMRMVGFAPYVNMMTFADIEGAITEAGLDVIETGLYPEPYSRFVVARKT